MKEAKDLSQEERDAEDYPVAEVDGVHLCVTRWFDSNVVHCSSTLYGCESMGSVQQWQGVNSRLQALCVRWSQVESYGGC